MRERAAHLIGKRAQLTDGYRFKNKIVILLCRVIDKLLALIPRSERKFPDQVKTILVIKPDHLGDMLTLTAVLPLLKREYEYAKIDVLCHELSLHILKNNPSVNRCVPFTHFLFNRKKISWVIKYFFFLRDVIKLVPKLRKERYDLCLNFRDSGGDMILLAKLCGCRFIAGHATGGFGPLLDRVACWSEGKHEVEHHLEVLEAVGVVVDFDGLDYELYPTAEDKKQVDLLIAKYRLNKFIVIHPGAGDRKKMATSRQWVDIINEIQTETTIVFTGTANEVDLYDEVACISQRNLVNLMGLFTINQLYLLFRRAERVYTVDSLSAHLAAMTGVKTTVFWPNHVDPDHWRPLGKNVELIGR